MLLRRTDHSIHDERPDLLASNVIRFFTDAPILSEIPAGTAPLVLYWSDARSDNFTTATEAGRRDAEAAGYRFVRTEGYIYPTAPRGTIVAPLKLYWSPAREDNFTTATETGWRDAEAASYTLVDRTEGFVLPSQSTPTSQRTLTVPLNLYWSDARADNFLTASDFGRQDAEAAGYRCVRVEGYIYPRAIALRAQRGQYVSIDVGSGGVFANGPDIHDSETFEVVYLGPDTIALRTPNGYYLSAQEGGGWGIYANSSRAAEWETFVPVLQGGGKIALRTYNGHFVCAEGGGGREVVANRTEIHEWETFELIGV